MSTALCNYPPDVFIAGDTVQFQIQNQNYPASAHTMQFVLYVDTIQPQAFDGAGQSDGSFIVTVSTAQTETILPEQYTAAFVYTSIAMPTTRKTIPHQTVWCAPDLTQKTSPTPNQTLLSTLQQALQSLAAGTIASATINQQTWTKKNLSQLQNQIFVTQTQVRKELEQLWRILGQPNQEIVQFCFAAETYYPNVYPNGGSGVRG